MNPAPPRSTPPLAAHGLVLAIVSAIVGSPGPAARDVEVHSSRGLVAARVTAIASRSSQALVDIRTAGGTIVATPEHPFSAVDGGWVAARDLVPGTRMESGYRPDGVEIQSVASRLVRGTEVYNLTVADAHVYFVGPDALLVHNTCGQPGAGSVDDGRTNPPDGPPITWPRPEPDPNLLSGHGQYQKHTAWRRKHYPDRYYPPKQITVPQGTWIVFPTRHGEPILDSYGNEIETWSNITPGYQYEGSHVYGPGEIVLNYTLLPPDGLTIKGHPTTVDRPTELKDLLEPGMGPVYWAACMSENCNPRWKDVPPGPSGDPSAGPSN